MLYCRTLNRYFQNVSKVLFLDTVKEKSTRDRYVTYRGAKTPYRDPHSGSRQTLDNTVRLSIKETSTLFAIAVGRAMIPKSLS
jgi:hypothetical protein